MLEGLRPLGGFMPAGRRKVGACLPKKIEGQQVEEKYNCSFRAILGLQLPKVMSDDLWNNIGNDMLYIPVLGYIFSCVHYVSFAFRRPSTVPANLATVLAI